jgi:hypothetical protein
MVGMYLQIPPRGERIRMAKEAVLELFERRNVLVAYDRELRYRLETKFPHDDVGEAIRQLKDERKLKSTGVPGRRGAGDIPNLFYRPPGTVYEDILPIMQKKLDLSIFITGVSREMGRHAELAWWRAFKKNGWDVYPSAEEEFRGVNAYKERRTSTGHDIDFIVAKDNITYGVELKNGLNYPNDLYWKLRVATELGTIPLVIARWLNPAQIPLVKKVGGEYIVYKDAMYPSTYQSMIEEVKTHLGLPVEVRDGVDGAYFTRKMEPIHTAVLASHTERNAKLRECFVHHRIDPSTRRTLGEQR